MFRVKDLKCPKYSFIYFAVNFSKKKKIQISLSESHHSGKIHLQMYSCQFETGKSYISLALLWVAFMRRERETFMKRKGKLEWL